MQRVTWPALVLVTALVLVVQLPGPHATAWHFFELAADLLTGRGPAGDGEVLSLYRDHPELQFGPLSIVAALPFTLLGETVGEAAVMVVGAALGLVVVRLLLTTFEDGVPWSSTGIGSFPAFTAAVLVVVTWGDVAVRTAHFDDAIAYVGIAAAVVWVARDQGGRATLALAFAAAAKPWAVMFVPLAAVPPGDRRFVRPIVAAALAVLTWVPFILAEGATLDTSDFEIENDPTSVLRALGVDAATTPDWVRPAQLVGGLALVGLVVVRRRWPAAVLAGVGWRLLLDPGAHRYYTIGFVLGAALLELRHRPERPPWMTIAGAALLEITAVPDVPVGPGQAARLAVVVAAIAAAWWSVPAETPELSTPGSHDDG